MKIALIRGPSLTPWEVQAFEPLARSHQVTEFVTGYTPQWNNRSTPIHIQRLFWIDQWFAPLHPRAAWLINGICSRLLGFSYAMKGLVPALEGFDIYHALETHNTYTYQALQAKRCYGGKLVVTVWETIPFRGETHPLRKSRKYQVLREADAFVAISERTREMLLREGAAPEKIIVQPMGIDCRFFSPEMSGTSPPFERQAGDFVILCVARFVAEKGVSDLLQAFEGLQKKSPSVRLVYIGRGRLETELRRAAANKGLAGRVHFARMAYADMPAAYAAADVVALPSHPTRHWEEQFGYALVEAMSMERPVISTTSGAIPEVVGREAGLLIPPGSVGDLAAALEKLMKDPSARQRMGKAGRQRALDLYEGSRVAARLLRLYEKLLGR